MSKFVRWAMLSSIGVLSILNTTIAATKKKKSSSKDFTVIEAYTQKVVPGKGGNPPSNGTHIIIKWTNSQEPETFFWRGDVGFLMCQLRKVHKIEPEQAKKFPKGRTYIYEDMSNGVNIKKGDTVELSPITGGRYPVPKEVTDTIKNTIFYKIVGNSNWKNQKVTSITKKESISMP